MTWSYSKTLTLLGVLLILPISGGGELGHAVPVRNTLPLSVDPSSSERLSPDGEKSLESMLDAAEMPDLHLPNFASYRKEVREFYEGFHGTLPWIDRGKPTTQARAIIRSLKNAADKGLSAEDYDGPQWDDRLSQFERSTTVSESDRVKFDLALTISAMRYVSDLHVGRVNPRLFHFGLDMDHRQIDLSDFLTQRLVKATSVDAVLEAVEPPFPIYRRTQDALKKYMEFARLDDGQRLPLPPRPVKPGEAYPGVPRLARLLALLGYLSAADRDAYANEIYQGPVIDALKHFQSHHGLAPNGIIDSPTLRQLNTPFSRRVRQLQLAMERMRWLPHQFAKPPIVVNIPEFRLYAVDDAYRSVFNMNVVVGKAYGYQTPVFANEIRQVIFRPYWNVPRSILSAELIPHLEKKSSFFSDNAYEIVDEKDTVVVVDPVNEEMESQLRSGKLKVRQTPGSHNALGLIKFEFPNRYDVYMHGTPAQELFSRSRRDFSHGCIRLEDPVKLATWVLRDLPNWNENAIRAAMNGDETIRVDLKKPIPVLIFYSTAVILEGGEDRFFDDIYGLDAALERALAQKAGKVFGEPHRKRE